MKPNQSFLNRPNTFWALTKLVSEKYGYSDRSSKGARLRRYKTNDLASLGQQYKVGSKLRKLVVEYLNYRAATLENEINPLLMDRAQAQETFEELTASYKPSCCLPYNKQKGEKKHLNYLTCLVNILTEMNIAGTFNENPRGYCLVTDNNGKLVSISSRWMDGAYPDVINPVAVWEIKEYYGTTTFGSRVADGVYETQLDGYEIINASKACGRKIRHYLFVDDRFTWWVKGKSYLCKLLDIMHMGLVDEVIFGREVLTRWPIIVKSWP